MAERADYRFVPDVAIAPGETISEILRERRITQADFALMLGRTEKNVSQLVNGKAPLSHELALDLERVLGVPASMWNGLEATYRDLLARQEESERLGLETAWASAFPIKYLRDEGLIAREASAAEQPGELLDFFAVASPDAWSDYWGSPRRLAARATGAYATDTPALATWLRLGELAAREVELEAYDARMFAEVVALARGMTVERADEAFPRLQGMCAGAGVAVVLVKELPRLRCHGVTRWLSDAKPVIQLCLRYKTADQLWFSFFHECCHVLRHGRKRTYIADVADMSPEEMDANAFAADTLIPPADWREFLVSGPLSKASVRSFAVGQGIDPGIVVGRLQHEKVIPFTHLNELKTRLEWAQ